MCAHQNRFGGLTAGPVVQHDWRTFGIRQMLIAPLHQDHDRREQIAAGIGQSVLVAVGVAGVWDAAEQSLAAALAIAKAESFWELPLIGRFLVPAAAARATSAAGVKVPSEQLECVCRSMFKGCPQGRPPRAATPRAR